MIGAGTEALAEYSKSDPKMAFIGIAEAVQGGLRRTLQKDYELQLE